MLCHARFLMVSALSRQLSGKSGPCRYWRTASCSSGLSHCQPFQGSDADQHNLKDNLSRLEQTGNECHVHSACGKQLSGMLL